MLKAGTTILLFGLVLILAACVPDAPDVTSVPVFAGGVPLQEEHTLAPGDEIEIRFPFNIDLNDRVAVGPDGHVSLQLINDVDLTGLTVRQATARVNELYEKVLRQPNASVTMRAYAPQVVYVDGWVTTPGLIRSDVPLTVSRALAQVGGAKTGAHTDSILLLRRGSDGKVYYYKVALGNYAGAENPAADVMLKSYDIVYVPETVPAQIADFLSTYTKSIPFYISASP